MTSLLVVTALRAEQVALTGNVPGARVVRCGMGATRFTRHDADAVAIAGTAGGLDASVRPGDVVVASEVRDIGGTRILRESAPLVAELRRLGLRVHHGPIVTATKIVKGAERDRLAASGALAVDMESAVIADAYRDVPTAVVRVVVDTAASPLLRPATVTNGARALHTLRRVGPALAAWAEMTGPRSALLAGPRSFCAGVERAIDIVDLTLQRHRRPVYVRREIVHNAHVVRDFESRGAVFVRELNEVPDNTTVVFSAHGVAPAVRDEAERRGLNVIDATCPLVAKVHAEARRFAGRGDSVVLIGHDGHDETEGTMGEAPGRISLVQSPADVDRLDFPDETNVAYLMQTTLAVDEAADTVAALKDRFPEISSSPTDDICYATTNRQLAVRDVAVDSDVVIVIGSPNSSNSLRLVEVARRAGARAHLVDDVTELLPRWFAGAARVGITAGASAPPHLVDDVVGTLRALGADDVSERVHTTEDITFSLPKGVGK